MKVQTMMLAIHRKVRYFVYKVLNAFDGKEYCNLCGKRDMIYTLTSYSVLTRSTVRVCSDCFFEGVKRDFQMIGRW